MEMDQERLEQIMEAFPELEEEDIRMLLEGIMKDEELESKTPFSDFTRPEEEEDPIKRIVSSGLANLNKDKPELDIDDQFQVGDLLW